MSRKKLDVTCQAYSEVGRKTKPCENGIDLSTTEWVPFSRIFFFANFTSNSCWLRVDLYFTVFWKIYVLFQKRKLNIICGNFTSNIYSRASSRCPRRGIPVMFWKKFHKKTENDFDTYIVEICRINVIQESNTFQGFSHRKAL